MPKCDETLINMPTPQRAEQFSQPDVVVKSFILSNMPKAGKILSVPRFGNQLLQGYFAQNK